MFDNPRPIDFVIQDLLRLRDDSTRTDDEIRLYNCLIDLAKQRRDNAIKEWRCRNGDNNSKTTTPTHAT